jgi:hypothetical protein
MNIPAMLAGAAMTLAAIGSADAKTDEREKIEVLYETTLNLIHLLVEQGVIKQEVADEMIRKAEQKAKASQQQAREQSGPPQGEEPKKGEVRVTYVPEHIKKEIRDQLREDVVGQAKQERWGNVNATPEWLDRFTLEGDMRLREQADFFGNRNAPAANFRAVGQQIDNTTEDSYHRERIRMRLGINANVTRGVDLGLRLTTGNVNRPAVTGDLMGDPILFGSPTSTLQTLGTFNSKFSLVLGSGLSQALSPEMANCQRGSFS